LRARDTRTIPPPVVRLAIRAKDYTDEGVGIVILNKPLVVLVPTHLVLLIEDGDATSITVDGETYERAEILSSPALAGDHLSLLRFKGRHRRKRPLGRLPKQTTILDPGQPLTLHIPSDEDSPANREGRVLEIRGEGEGASLTTDISVVKGESGSAICVGGQLAAVCQGMSTGDSGGTAIAVPISTDGLHALRGLRRKRLFSMLSLLISLTLVLVAAFAGWFFVSWQSFQPSSIELRADGYYLQANNGKRFTIRPYWRRAFETDIYKTAMVPTLEGDEVADYIAVGTWVRDGVNGAFILLDRLGRELWRYAVPDGECIYSTSKKVYNKFLVGHINFGDLTGDGQNELVAAFMHEYDEPCKLMVFDLAGNILAEYWHPGYVRTTAIGRVGSPEDPPMLVLTASNNPLQTSWWNPQTIFAFRGLEISGQSPPYCNTQLIPVDYPTGTELWVREILNPNGEEVRAKCREIDILDINGDGITEIRTYLSDGRFYFLDAEGNTIYTDIGDRWSQLFGDLEPPALRPVARRDN